MLSTSDGPEARRSGGGLWPDAALTMAFYLLFLLQLVHHSLWRDELNAFGLALASPTLGALFSHVRYEGHPWLWYFILWVAGRFTFSVAAIKVIEACVVAATYGLLGLRSPFSRAEKTLLFLGYFISFEYAVLSRMYSLLLMFLLVYLWRRSGHPEQVIANCLLLSLLPSTDIMGLILSLGLLAEYGVSLYLSQTGDRKTVQRQLMLGAGAYAVVAAIAVWSARPAQDIGWRTTGSPFVHLFDGTHLIASAVSYTVMPFFPVGFGHLARSFWNPDISQHPALYLTCFPLILYAYYSIFRRRGRLLVLVSVVLILAIAFGHLVFGGTMRHWGVTFLGFLAALWLLKRGGLPLPPPAWILLGLSALGGVYTAWAQWRRPFSNAEAAAIWLRAHHLEGAPIAGTPDTTVASLAVLLHRSIYMLDCNCDDSYVLFSRRRDDFNRTQIPERLFAARSNLGGDLLYIDTYPLTQDLGEGLLKCGLISRELSRMTGSTFAGEDFYIYQIHDVAPR